MPKAKLRGGFSSTVQGIPCLIEVLMCNVVKGSSRADNPDDYYGYTEVEFSVRDRQGYLAPWLERKMTEDDRHRIETEIVNQHGERDDY